MEESLLEVLMRRDDMTQEEAEAEIAEAKAMVALGSDPEEVLHDMFQLEPDYVFDLL
jgi:hypothetical protein